METVRIPSTLTTPAGKRVINLPHILAELNKHHRDYLIERGVVNKFVKESTHFSCPIHEDSTPSAHFLPDGSGHGYCFGCGTRFSILDSFVAVEGISPPDNDYSLYAELLLPLADKYSIRIAQEDLTPQEREQWELGCLINDIAGYLTVAPLSPSAQKEVESRGIHLARKNLGVGSVSAIENLVKYLTETKKHSKTLVDDYLSNPVLLGPDFLTFPVRGIGGETLGFTSKNLLFKKGDPGGKKYINSPNSSTFRKSDTLLGIDRVAKLIRIGKVGPVYIVEGPLDLSSLIEYGIDHAVAVCGSTLSKSQIQLLRQAGVRSIVIAMDGDSAGKKATTKIVKELAKDLRGISASIAILPEDKDPDDILRAESGGVEVFKSLELVTPVVWLTEVLKDAGDSDPYRIAEIICPFVADNPDPLQVHRDIKALSVKIGIPEKVLEEKVTSLQAGEKQAIKRKRDYFIQEAIERLQHQPEDALITISSLSEQLSDLESSASISGKYSFDECRSAIDAQEEMEDTQEGGLAGCVLPRKPLLQNTLYSSWVGRYITLAGDPNLGKTSFLCDLTIDMLEGNDGIKLDPFGARTTKTIVFYHTVDDSRELIINRLVTILAARMFPAITLNMTSNPNLHKKHLSNPQPFLDARKAAYSMVKDLVDSGRLMVKSAKHGSTLDFAKMQMGKIREMFPADSTRLIYIIDNLSKVDPTDAAPDSIMALKKISAMAKRLAEFYDATVIASIEYRKASTGFYKGQQQTQVQSDNDMAGPKSLWYDADVTLHFRSEFANDMDSIMYWKSDDRFQPTPITSDGNKWPVVTVFISKNKMSEAKNVSLFFDMIPPQASFREVSKGVVDSRLAHLNIAQYSQDTAQTTVTAAPYVKESTSENYPLFVKEGLL